MSNPLPPEMTAITIEAAGEPDVLVPRRVAMPVPDDDQVLVRVIAAGVNRPDVLQRRGLYAVPPDASPIPGLEVAGTVAACGRGVRRWRPGDEVMALTHGGGYAEFVAVDEGHCLRIPAAISPVEAAAVPETFFTVWYNVFNRASLARGETLLVHGGSSGIGTTAIQLGRVFGASVIVTAGSDEKCRFCLGLGAKAAFNYRSSDWAADVRSFTDGRGVDVVLDMVAGPYVDKNLQLLAQDGRYAIIAFLGGTRADACLRPLLGRRLTITGSTLRPQTAGEKSAIATDLALSVLPFLDSGEVAPIIDSVFPLTGAADAHRLMESSRHMGKIVLRT